MTPGRYLSLRRAAAGLSVEDVAERLTTEPLVPEYRRIQMISMIEAGTSPATFGTIAALRRIYPFDLDILEQLALRDLGLTDQQPRICRGCGCSHYDPCRTGEGPCGWADHVALPADTLCTACPGPATTPPAVRIPANRKAAA